MEPAFLSTINRLRNRRDRCSGQSLMPILYGTPPWLSRGSYSFCGGTPSVTCWPRIFRRGLPTPFPLGVGCERGRCPRKEKRNGRRRKARSFIQSLPQRGRGDHEVVREGDARARRNITETAQDWNLICNLSAYPHPQPAPRGKGAGRPRLKMRGQKRAKGDQSPLESPYTIG